ncbi:MAG TPA: hypothetical protein PKO44_03970 [Candidatus Omnitrophota bacterium]|nr:hypothetical protein [Candidatus Omnitrophota bacterium]
MTGPKRKFLAITLMELLVTVIIVGLLAGISVIGFQKTVRKADAKRAKTNLLAIKAAQVTYFAKYGYYYANSTVNGCTAGGTVMTADINNALGLNLTETTSSQCQPLFYRCFCSSTYDQNFHCIAICNNGSWSYKITTSYGVPEDMPQCVVAGTCPE